MCRLLWAAGPPCRRMCRRAGRAACRTLAALPRDDRATAARAPRCPQGKEAGKCASNINIPNKRQ